MAEGEDEERQTLESVMGFSGFGERFCRRLPSLNHQQPASLQTYIYNYVLQERKPCNLMWRKCLLKHGELHSSTHREWQVSSLLSMLYALT